MKIKRLLIILLVVVLLFLYSSFCYIFLNHTVDINSREVISNYINTIYGENVKYKYIKAINNNNNTLSIYLKVNNKYYNFIMVRNAKNYKILDVRDDVPEYIKIR